MTIPRLMPDTFLWREEGKMQMRAAAELGMATGREGGREGGRRMRMRGLQAPGLDFNQGHPATAIPESLTRTHARARTGLYYPSHTRFWAIQFTSKTSCGSTGSKFGTAVELQVSTFIE